MKVAALASRTAACKRKDRDTSDPAVPGGSREGPGDAGKEPSTHPLPEQSNACFASCTGGRFPQAVLGWRASATVCPAAAMAPTRSMGVPAPSPAASCALQRAQQPRETGGVPGVPGVPGCSVLGCPAERDSELSQSGKASGRQGRWAKMLRVKECSRRPLLVVSLNAGAEGWLWPRRERDWTVRRRQSCLLSSE